MSRRVLTPWLLIASLLIGLWTAAAHEVEHAATSPHAELCAICAFASGAAGALPGAGFLLFLLSLSSVRLLCSVAAVRRAHAARVRVRGPPLFLA